MSDLPSSPPPKLPEIRAQRADAEEQYQQAMRKLSASNASDEDLAAALGYHREVFALYAAELSLIESGKLMPAPRGCAACDRGDFQLGHAEWCPKYDPKTA